PKTGVYSWLDDSTRGPRYWPDYFAIAALQPGQPVKVKLPLNALYRFDQPGHYTVHVVSRRVSSGPVGAERPVDPLTSNEVRFEVVPMSDSDEAAEAAS